MRKLYFVIVCFFMLSQTSFSQAVMPDNVRAAATLDRLSTAHDNMVPDFLYGINAPPGKVVGDTYLNTDWRTASVLLYEGDKLIEGFPARYDIQANEVEFNAKNGIKVLNGSKIKSFVWLEDQNQTAAYFINAKEFKTPDNVPLTGFFQVLSDGAMPLLKRVRLVVKKPDYNVAINMGSPDAKILKSVEYYYVKDKQVIKLPSSTKKVIAVFGDKADVMKKYADENSLSAGKESELIKLFEHYNESMKN